MDNLLISIEKATEFIECNLSRKIALDEIADACYMSKYHLHRIMSAAARRPLMDYVRARKLASSLDMLLHSDYPIMHIAQEHGFEYEQSYIRAFVSEYGVTPARFRKGRFAIKLTEKINIAGLKPIDNGIIFETGFVLKSAFYLVGNRHYFSPEMNWNEQTANKVGNDFFYHVRDQIPNALYPDTYIGFTKWVEGDPNSNSYLPSVEVPSNTQVPAEMSCEWVKTHKYAVFQYIGDIHPKQLTYQHLSSIWSYINDEWLPNSGYVIADPFFYESIDVSVANDHYCEVNLYIPIAVISTK
ncbi:AraC family transcriptional regulator [Paenibacillus sp.]|jgi:AraC family transcriptional regulator|uniref:AraC family transcriptional regulator n=1 Tax=Paenibacillus sp. TaxID=58172 RepID=UPI0028284B7C|nr:AraC family transcriptional regulator [Paenibacillus sp.]MDR0268685.1 AraC family transcriptional regulator [Paenibacillus sp.]